MIGAFKPSAPLSGGLLWKIPWRLSPPQKLRQRRRLRRVDNVVAVLSTALKRASISTSTSSTSSKQPSSSSSPIPPNQATLSDLSTTAEGLRLLTSSTNSAQDLRRAGRGPKQGDYVPAFTPHGVHKPGSKLLRQVVAEEGTLKQLERWRAAMPVEAEMPAKDKYTIFDKKVKGYRKGVHKLPKWTRVSQRVNPPGF